MEYAFSGRSLNVPPKRDMNRSLLLIPADEIDKSPNQPRRDFDRDSLSELMVSIAQVGLIQPLTVRSVGSRYELIAGERRLRACQMLGMREIPCVVQRAGAEQSAAMTLIENLQRQNLNCLEEADCCRRLMDEQGLTQEQLALRLGKSQSYLSNKLRLLKLSPAVRELFLKSGLTERHARALLLLSREEDRLDVLRRAKAGGWTVQRTEAYAAERCEKNKPPRMRAFFRDDRLFLNSIRVSAEQLRKAGASVTIHETKREDGVDMVISVRHAVVTEA